VRILITFASLFCFLDIAFDSARQGSSLMVHPENPGAYIVAGRPPCHSTDAFRLVLHNNYTVPIFVQLSGLSESGDVIPSFEVVAEGKNNKQIVTVVSNEVFTSQMVKSGGQISVCVDRANLRQDNLLRIPFEFEGDSPNVQQAAPQHFAVFYANSVNEHRSRK
jgi:hypothetical protein